MWSSRSPSRNNNYNNSRKWSGTRRLCTFGGGSRTRALLGIQRQENESRRTDKGSVQGTPRSTQLSTHFPQDCFLKHKTQYPSKTRISIRQNHDTEFKLYHQVIQMAACLCNSPDQHVPRVLTETAPKSDHGCPTMSSTPSRINSRYVLFIKNCLEERIHTDIQKIWKY